MRGVLDVSLYADHFDSYAGQKMEVTGEQPARFYAYHSSLSPAEAVWPFDKFCRYGEEAVVDDLFRTGYVDMGILNSTYLYEFYKNGFNSHAQNNVIKAKYPDRFLLCGSFDPRDEETGVDAFRRMVAEYPVQGLKLYTAEWVRAAGDLRASTVLPASSTTVP